MNKLMIKKTLKWSMAASFFYVIFLLATLPMATVLSYFPKSEKHSYEGVTGTFWQGGLQTISVPEGRLSNVQWQVRPLSLLMGQLVEDIKFGAKDELSGKGHFGSGLFGYYAEDLQLSMPATLIINKLPLPIPLTATGDLELNLVHGSGGTPLCASFDGELKWLDGVVETPAGKLKLQQLKAVLSCQDGMVNALITEQSEQMSLELSLQLKGKQQYKLTGWIKAEAGMPKMIANSLNFIGEKDPQGRYRVNLIKDF